MYPVNDGNAKDNETRLKKGNAVACGNASVNRELGIWARCIC